MAGFIVDTTSGLSVQCISALDTARDGGEINDNVGEINDDNVDEINDGNADDNYLVLTNDQVRQVDSFRTQLLDRTDDAEKFQLCAEKCNELLRDDTRLQILIAAYDDVMSAVCRGYESKKKEKAGARTPLPTSRRKKTDDSAERDE